MKNNLIINTNILQALSNLQENHITYAPVIKSEPQSYYHKRRYQQILKRYPEASYTELGNIKEVEDADKYALWDTTYEAQKNNIPQNRLFNYFEDIPEGFTPFKKLAEKKLPKFFDDAITPFDEDVIEQLDYYFWDQKLAHTYFETRNGMLHRNDSTRFSSYLSCGALDVKYLYNQVKKYEKEVTSNKSTYWITFELLWREYFYWHYQKHQNKYFSANGLKGALDFSNYPQIDIDELIDQYGDNPFILAASRELKTTGFQTNRTRQIFASFLIHCTQYHWRQGASLFENYLVDYDVYSNWGNWMYLAGVGVDPRGSRFFHIPKQMKNYDPNLEYIRHWCPEYKALDRSEILQRCLNHQV